ncbi:MAG: hypothetical protein WAW61_21785 [Methylococcaceae bacterium]
MNAQEIDDFEQLQAQLQSLFQEIGTFAKKKPDDAVNKFKLKLTNTILNKANTILANGRPFEDFSQFDDVDIPTNSDVIIILSQYLNCLEKLRSDNVTEIMGDWYWKIDENLSSIPTAPPRKLKY